MSKGGKDVDLSQVRNEPSMVGKKLEESTTRRVIILVLALLLCLPFFDGMLNDTEDKYQEFGIRQLLHMPQDLNATGSVPVDSFKMAIQTYVRNAGRVLYFEVCVQECRTVWPKSITDSWIKEIRFQKEKVTDDFTETTNPDTGWQPTDMLTKIKIKQLYRANEAPGVVTSGCYDVQDKKG